MNFAKFFRTPFFIEHVWWLLLLDDVFDILVDVFFIILVNILSKFFVANSNFEFSLVFTTISSTPSDVT